MMESYEERSHVGDAIAWLKANGRYAFGDHVADPRAFKLRIRAMRKGNSARMKRRGQDRYTPVKGRSAGPDAMSQPPTPLYVTRKYCIRGHCILTKTWVTNDGRWLRVDEMDTDHLHKIRHMLHNELPPGYDLATGLKIAQDWLTLAQNESLPDECAEVVYDALELDLDAFRASWIQIVDDELSRRAP